MKLICNTSYFKQLIKGKEYEVADTEKQEFMGKEVELVRVNAETIDGTARQNFQRFQKSNFISENNGING